MIINKVIYIIRDLNILLLLLLIYIINRVKLIKEIK